MQKKNQKNAYSNPNASRPLLKFFSIKKSFLVSTNPTNPSEAEKDKPKKKKKKNFLSGLFGHHSKEPSAKKAIDIGNPTDFR